MESIQESSLPPQTHPETRETNKNQGACFKPLEKQVWCWSSMLLLMLQKSGQHQLRLVVHPINYMVLYIPGG